jgi:hypothetical protein
MTRDEAAELVIEHMNYAAYKETDSSLYDADKNRLFGEEHYKSGRIIVRSSPWADGNFEDKMVELLGLATGLSRRDNAFAQAQQLLEAEDSLLGRLVRRSKSRGGQ